jgi:hypothetical protein
MKAQNATIAREIRVRIRSVVPKIARVIAA